jgi:hypothetical protein
MIINATTVVVTLLGIAVAAYIGLHFVRKFALEIAQENHDAIMKMDAAEDEARVKRERQADEAAASAYAKVSTTTSGNGISTGVV